MRRPRPLALALCVVAGLLAASVARAAGPRTPGARANGSEVRGLQARGLQSFIRRSRPALGRQTYVRGVRIPTRLGTLLSRRARTERAVVNVNGKSLGEFIESTKKGYLEVVVPASTGHVWFRHGEKLYDFGPRGFRVSGVRPISKERYGALIKLSKAQERRLSAYLDHLEASNGADLGEYDFEGDKGFHCVTWIMRQPLEGGKNLGQMLGGKARDISSMPDFSRFVMKRARGVEAVVVYSPEPMSSKALEATSLDLMSHRQLRKAFREAERERVWGSSAR